MRRLLIVLLGAVLAGCAVGPDYVRPPVPAPAGWRVAYEAAAGVADLRWWREFGDPVLDALVAEGVRNNLDLRVAAARVDQYAGRLESTRSELFPQLTGTLNPAVDHIGRSGTTELHRASLNVTWEIDLWGRLRRASEAARARLLASEAGRRGTLLTVVADVAGTYLTLRGLDRQLEIARDTESSHAETLRLFRLRYTHGTIDRVTLSQQEAEYETARQEIPRLEAEIRQTENALSLLQGRPPGPIPRGRELDALTSPGIPAGLPSQLLERRPDIIEAEENLAAATAQIGVEKAGYFPSLSLTGGGGGVSSDLRRLLVSGTTGFWSAAGQLAGPILDFGRTSGTVQEAEALRDQELSRYRKAVLQGFAEVEDALVKTTTGRERLASQERQVEALREYARLSRLQFEAGTTDYLTVLDATTRLFAARLAATRTRSDLLLAVVGVYKAMGGGWVTEAERLQEGGSPEGEGQAVPW